MNYHRTMPNPVVGQVLFSLPIGNACRPSLVERKLTPVVVTKIGRKYFDTVSQEHPTWRGERYELGSWKQDTGGYSATSYLFTTEQEWFDENEADQLNKAISKKFEFNMNHGLNLDQLRRINAILNENASQDLTPKS